MANTAIFLVAASVLFSQQAPSTAPITKPFKPVAEQALHNAHIVTDKVISGAQPEGEESFRALRDLGVKTIISVDGAKPDVELATKYGMRYVHLPITYSTVTPEQGQAIAKAINELPGPVYIHCHHGRHRSAAAVAVACVYNGQLKPEQAEDVLKTFGTGANYTGLWKVAREARPLDPQVLKDLKVEFPSVSKVTALAEVMVLVDQHNDHLKQVQAAGWKSPPEHPDLDPAHEALQLQEHFQEIGRTEQTRARPEDFRKILLDGEEASKALHAALQARPVNTTAAQAAFQRVATSCTSCHKVYRD